MVAVAVAVVVVAAVVATVMATAARVECKSCSYRRKMVEPPRVEKCDTAKTHA